MRQSTRNAPRSGTKADPEIDAERYRQNKLEELCGEHRYKGLVEVKNSRAERDFGKPRVQSSVVQALTAGVDSIIDSLCACM